MRRFLLLTIIAFAGIAMLGAAQATAADGEQVLEASGAMLDTEGQFLTDTVYDGFSRSVACQPATVASVDLVAVTVEVDYLGNEMTTVTTLIGY